MILPQEFFALLSDETRLRCLVLLHKKGEVCVCEFTQILGIIQPKVSRHLAHLRKSGLVLDERRGQWVYYRLNPDLPKWMGKLLHEGLESLRGIEPFRADLKPLSSKLRPC
ncbi:MAG: Arsenic resistance transcriptional regulator ArsR2 [Chlamydiales bacterium]|nr:Arsenic resistance transcriptional regulator ArsR2 [Chlamydiales bacterium]